MSAGVWDGIDKQRVVKAVTTAFGSDEYLEALAAVHNAETLEELTAARQTLKELMAFWREEIPAFAFMIDCLYIYSDKVLRDLTGQPVDEA